MEQSVVNSLHEQLLYFQNQRSQPEKKLEVSKVKFVFCVVLRNENMGIKSLNR